MYELDSEFTMSYAEVVYGIFKKNRRCPPELVICQLDGIEALEYLESIRLAYFASYQGPKLSDKDLPHLKKVTVSGSQLIPDSFTVLPKLEELHLAYVHLNIPNNVETLNRYQQISSLDMHLYGRDAIPENIYLPNVKKLRIQMDNHKADLSNHTITTLAKSFPNLEQLFYIGYSPSEAMLKRLPLVKSSEEFDNDDVKIAPVENPLFPKLKKFQIYSFDSMK